MKPPYDRSYLDFVVEEQGRFFELLQDVRPEVDSADFIASYMKSSTRRQLDEGHAYYLTMDAPHLKETFMAESGYVPKAGEPIRGFAPNWIGRFYARYQWETGMPSSDVIGKVPLDWLVRAYPGLHDLDLGVAVRKVAGESLSSVGKTSATHSGAACQSI